MVCPLREMESDRHRIRYRDGLLVAAELALAVAVMVMFEFDLAKPLGWDALWVVPVFLVHAHLPLAWRRAFLLGATGVLLVRLLGATAAAYVSILGAILIGLCHLPVAHRWRVLAVVALAVALALVEAKWLNWGHHIETALPILGGIFMFRLVLYLYDIRHEKPGAATPLERIGYFFLLPAPLAPFFPTLDYQVYRRSWYREPAFGTYQTGMLWIARGVVHLALYRVVYQFFSPSPEQVVDLGGVAVFCLSGYLIYLRVSGLFHIVSGLLRLFGYALPETHRLYFFATDFSDYWRRINIYWKEFMTKIVFYPAFTRLRRTGLGHQGRLALATIIVFIATAILHSYQTFWLRGRFEFHETDLAFWGVLGFLVVGNNLLDARRPQTRTPVAKTWEWRRAAGLSLRALGLFVLFAVLWALWSSQKWRVFGDVMRQARRAPALQVVTLLGIGAGTVILGTVGQWFAHHGFNLFEERPGPRRTLITIILPLSALALAWQYHSAWGIPGWWGGKFDVVWIDQPNARDRVNGERSYYEGLLAGGPSVGAEEEALVKKVVPDVRGVVYRERFGPAVVWGAKWSTNSWGMRDQYYSKAKPPGIYRIAISGASYVSGRGVPDGATFESLIEDRLNADGVRVEILNFGTSASCVVQRLADLELRMVDFAPDAFFIVCHEGEMERNLRALALVVADGKSEYTYPYLEELFQRAGVKRGAPQAETIRALTPHAEELTRWAFGRIAEVCRERAIKPVWVFLPNTRTRSIELGEEARRYAEEAGLMTIMLDDAYSDIPWERLVVSEADTHPNELGHRAIAASLFKKMRACHRELGMPDLPAFVR
jgi:hypothetical protein